MFIRIDKDVFLNINNIAFYKLYDEGDAYKLTIWGIGGTVLTTIYYIKNDSAQMDVLIQFNNAMRERTINPELIIPVKNNNYEEDIFNALEEAEKEAEKTKHIEEQLSIDSEELYD